MDDAFLENRNLSLAVAILLVQFYLGAGNPRTLHMDGLGQPTQS